jgi:hypothetical protein
MRTILIVFLIFCTTCVFGHEDTLIKLKKDGTLVGLPEKYSPATFSTTDFILEIGNRRISLPECVTSFFANMDDPTFSFSASWYHSKPILQDYEPLPDYMSMVISSSNDNQSDIQVLFNLETLEVFEINILQENVTVDGTRYLLYYNEQEISQHCEQEILNSIREK